MVEKKKKNLIYLELSLGIAKKLSPTGKALK